MTIKIRRCDVPTAPAYVVFHDAFDKGAMEVWPVVSFAVAQEVAAVNNKRSEDMGHDECGGWAAYEKLPRVRIWKLHLTPWPVETEAANAS